MTDDVTRNEDGFIVTSGQVGVLALRQGDCFLDWGTGQVEIVDAVPCRSVHDRQVIDIFEMDAGAWPGITAVSEAAVSGCRERYRPATATELDPLVVALTALAPTEGSWAQDRTVLCIAASATDEQLQGSLVAGNL